MTATTSASVMIIVTWTSLNDSRIVFERSRRTLACTDVGSSATNDGRSARTASVTSMTFVPGCFWMASVIDALRSGLGEQPRALRQRLHAVDDVGHLFEADRPAVAVRDDDRPKTLGAVQQPLGLCNSPLVLIV